MASTPNYAILASDWLKGHGFQVHYKSSMLIGSVMSQIIIFDIKQGGDECSNGRPSSV